MRPCPAALNGYDAFLEFIKLTKVAFARPNPGKGTADGPGLFARPFTFF
jgi:hypothetical protein